MPCCHTENIFPTSDFKQLTEVTKGWPVAMPSLWTSTGNEGTALHCRVTHSAPLVSRAPHPPRPTVIWPRLQDVTAAAKGSLFRLDLRSATFLLAIPFKSLEWLWWIIDQNALQTNLLTHPAMPIPTSKWPAAPGERGRGKNMTATWLQISGGYVFRHPEEPVKDSSLFLLQSSNTTGLPLFPTKTIPLRTRHQMT